ncbi:ankyrin repeat domain-containing protein [Novosphingobium aerophilum]|uniref:Ankyrin repeat domain-containing protein n=1 Tax=Novosphingobium aerophilum TaxID=2839843 RepID=A0A7X1KBJ0_9SPHN|nr:hypothetical protein [Novosphingobium aerophilum]MBC2651351.1 hypothetical protein [Novosphingobium aerophilum]
MIVVEDGQHPLFEAIDNADLAEIARLVASGADVGMRDFVGEPAIFKAVTAAEFAEDGDEREQRMDVVRGLMELGASLTALDDNGRNILVGPILGLRVDMVGWLLEQGVNPNHGCAEPWETICDLAMFDYEHEAWMARGLAPLNPPSGVENPDAWLAWVDHEAAQLGYLRPTLPLLLRQHGALTGAEMAAKLGGTPQQGVEWKRSAWRLKEAPSIESVAGDLNHG